MQLHRNNVLKVCFCPALQQQQGCVVHLRVLWLCVRDSEGGRGLLGVQWLPIGEFWYS